MAAWARKIGIKIVDDIVDNPRALKGLHAEEKLLYAVPDIKFIGTSFRAPCGPGEHGCAAALHAAGVEVRDAVKNTKTR